MLAGFCILALKGGMVLIWILSKICNIKKHCRSLSLEYDYLPAIFQLFIVLLQCFMTWNLKKVHRFVCEVCVLYTFSIFWTWIQQNDVHISLDYAFPPIVYHHLLLTFGWITLKIDAKFSTNVIKMYCRLK